MAREFGKALKDKGDDVRVFEVKKRDHMSILLDALCVGDPVEQAMREFMDKHLAK